VQVTFDGGLSVAAVGGDRGWHAASAAADPPDRWCQLRPAGGGASPQTLARSWQAQRRLYARYKTMTARSKPAAVAVTAMARELAGFVWAEMTS
jgi:hypothetical protein